MNRPAHSEEEQLEELYLSWLKAHDEQPATPPRTWVFEHAKPELQEQLLDLIQTCQSVLAGPKDLVSGEILGEDFELLEEIGSGGFGWVWKARQQSLDRVVAVKVLRLLAGVDCDHLLEREGKHLAAIRHPGIVEIHSVGRDGEHLFLAMEYIRGVSLAHVLNRIRDTNPHALGTPVGDRVGVNWVLRIAEAVAAMHARGIYHRDLKPGNVLLNAEGRVKIADFGLSTLAADVEQPFAGGRMGTPEYLPPEAHTGTVDGSRTDLWALGAMLFELVALEGPFGSDHTAEVLRRGRAGEVGDLATLRPDLSREIRAVCMKALARRPDERYADAVSFAEDLARILRAEPVSVSPASAVVRASMWVQRNRWLTATGSLVLVLFLSWGFFSLRQTVAAAEEVEFEIVHVDQLEAEGHANSRQDTRSIDTPSIDSMLAAPEGTLVSLYENSELEVAAGSLLFLRLEVHRPTWLYVFNRGSSGRTWVNFPYSWQGAQIENPFVPEESNSESNTRRVLLGRVDEQPGRETFLVVLCSRPSPQMELLCQRLRDEPAPELLASVFRGLAREQTRDIQLPMPDQGGSELSAFPSEYEFIWNGRLRDVRAELGYPVYRWSFQHR